MRTDDEILERVRSRASTLRRRRQALRGGGAAALLLVAVLTAAMVAGSSDNNQDLTTGPGETTTTEAPVATRPPASTRPTPSTPATTGPSTTPPATTSPPDSSKPPSETRPPTTSPPPEPEGGGGGAATSPPATTPPTTTSRPSRPPDVTVRNTATRDGLRLDVAATYSQVPGERTVKITVRLRLDPSSSREPPFYWAATDSALGPVSSCFEWIAPGGGGGAVDETFSTTWTYSTPGDHAVGATIYSTSDCQPDTWVLGTIVAIEIR